MDRKKKYTTYLILFSIFCCQCTDKSVSINQSDKPVQELKKMALENGDNDAYEKLSIGYMDSPYEGFLYTALIMANKYNNKFACMDVFYCLTDFHHKDNDDVLAELDPKTRLMALEYLKLAAENGEINAKELLGKYYIEGLYLPKNEEHGKQLIDESEKLKLEGFKK